MSPNKAAFQGPFVWAVLLTVGAGLTGCNRQPQIGPENRRLIDSLQTAVMAKNPEWLEANEKLIEARHQEGKLRDEEYEPLQAIVRKAKAGDWSTAAEEVRALAKGQST
jgi:hypothetical protein